MQEVSPKIAKAFEAFKEAALRESQYKNILKINHCLPKHKEKRINTVTTGYLVRRQNANQAFQALNRKLSTTESMQLRSMILNLR